jgi:hypothetical protein
MFEQFASRRTTLISMEIQLPQKKKNGIQPSQITDKNKPLML